MADLRQILKTKGVKPSNKPERKINFHTEEILEIYENRKQTLPVEEPEFIPTEEFPLIKEMPLGISVESKQEVSILKASSSHLLGKNKSEGSQVVVEDKASSSQEEVKTKAIGNQKVSTNKASSRQNKQDAQFIKTPCRLDYRLLKGIKKQIVSKLIDANGVDGVQIINSELAQEVGISKEHFFSEIDRLKEKGYIRFESHYGWRVYFINPSILID